MRFISIFTHEPVNRAPTQAEMAAMGKLVEDAMREGWLLSTEGVSFGTKGFRVHKPANGKITVTDGPFAEAKEVIGGYAAARQPFLAAKKRALASASAQAGRAVGREGGVAAAR